MRLQYSAARPQVITAPSPSLTVRQFVNYARARTPAEPLPPITNPPARPTIQ